MHGVKRSRIPPVADSAEVERKKREKEAKRIEEYTGLVTALRELSDAKEYSREALELSGKVLALNPEYQTAWGVRRRVLVGGIFPSLSHEEKIELLQADLQLTNEALKGNPKNYSVWEHRKWCLETMGEGADWGREMKICEAFLERDGRNFHSWDYRRYLVASILALPPSPSRPQITTTSELAYTTRKISASFSNFSAWHYRTKMLQKLWEEQGCDEESEERRARVDEEFELVKQANWSDPNDQSAWLYHRWLVGKGSVPIVRREISGIEELLEEEPDSRWCLDSLVYYKRLLVTLLEPLGESTREEREALNLKALGMLRKLEQVDPMRGARYRDLAVHILPTKR